MSKGVMKREALPKERLDRLLVDRGFVISRERAQGLIIAGKVWVGGQPILKVGTKVSAGVEIMLVGEAHPYVSRGGMKLAGALKGFSIDPKGKVVMDVGASTGGFTDCLLQHGARRVYAVDVGYGQLAWSIRTDPRVVVLERVNIRGLGREQFHDEIDLATVDVSFISLRKVIPPLMNFLREEGEILALIKPQFEVGKGRVEKGGIIRSEAQRDQVVAEIEDFLLGIGCKLFGVLPSVLRGQKGNQEYFIYARRGQKADG
jgi:23S rRNA (cytidine1920-2'-O)/16S rRNA (cytidine1409-2'-O)-methyltransferase